MRIEYCTGRELYEISKNRYILQEQHFKYLDVSSQDYLHYILVYSNENIIVGILGYMIDARYCPNLYGLSFVSVHPKYRKRHISTVLLRTFFERYIEKYYHCHMYISRYSSDGEMYVYPQLCKLSGEFNIIPLNLHQ